MHESGNFSFDFLYLIVIPIEFCLLIENFASICCQSAATAAGEWPLLYVAETYSMKYSSFRGSTADQPQTHHGQVETGAQDFLV